MKRLIVNADDFGWSEAVTSGILQAHREGIVTSTTLMTNAPGAEESLARARREAPGLALGVHLNLTEGRPLAPADEVAAILGPDGCLVPSLAALYRKVRVSEAARRAAIRELDAQVGWALAHGLEPSHVDGHKHVHLMPPLAGRVAAMAARHGIRAMRTTVEFRPRGLGRLLPAGWGVGGRLRQVLLRTVAVRWGRRARRAVREAGLATTDWFFGVRATGGISAPLLEHVLRQAPEGTGELMVHPGLAEDTGDRPTRLADSRPRELEALCDPRVRQAAAAAGCTWATYKDLDHDQPR
ncbi:MAG: ChbG/HpnK family deacetylase [Planctomycetes bacterium]|nr:ChbG/HpnK family deacetylase [Planctomycetota bacterium]